MTVNSRSELGAKNASNASVCLQENETRSELGAKKASNARVCLQENEKPDGMNNLQMALNDWDTASKRI